MKEEVIKRLKKEFPEWVKYISIGEKDSVMDVPCLKNSKSGGIVVQVTNNDDIWFRIYSPNSSTYIEDIDELIHTIKMFVNDEILFQIIYDKDKWIETNLIYNNNENYENNSQIYSWSGEI